MQKLKQTLSIFLLSLIIVNPTLVLTANAQETGVTGSPTYQGVEGSISKYLCTPSATPDGHDLERCINKLYKFGISFGAIALVFFVVLAGYMYITEGESGKAKAKGILQNALVGMLILLGSYVILSFINPSLVVIKPIQPPIFVADDIPLCENIGFDAQCSVKIDGGSMSSDASGVFGGAYDHAKSATFATTILANNKIVLNCYDNTFHGPKKNLEDAKAQQPSQTNSRGKTYLHQDMLNGLIKVATVVNSYCISELAGGNHSNNSRHYVGLGFDIATINGSTANKSNPGSAKVMEACRAAGATEILGPIKPDANHETHVHCGWPRPR